MAAGGGVEVGKAYVTIVPSAKDFSRKLNSEISKPAEQAGALAGSNYEKGFDAGEVAKRSGGFLGKAFKSVAVGVGVHVGQTLGKAMSGGLERLKAVDAASAKLRGLGMDAQSSAKVMGNAMDSVKGTAFGMGDAVTVAASAVAAGIKPGDELTGMLKGVANAAAATGSGMTEMGAIFNKVKTVNKATNESLLQLSDRGLPIYEKLAEKLGVTTSEVEKMASKGQIDFDTFQAAAKEAAGTVADEMGNTASGSLDNFGAALSRFGESALGGLFQGLAPALQQMSGWVDKAAKAVEPFAQQVGAWLVGAFDKLADFISTKAIPALSSFGGWVNRNEGWLGPLAAGLAGAAAAFYSIGRAIQVVNFLKAAGGIMRLAKGIGLVRVATTIWTGVQAAFNAVMAANPVMLIVLAVGALVSALVVAYKKCEPFKNFVDNLFNDIKNVIDGVVDWFKTTVGPALTSAWAGIKTAVSAVGNVFKTVWDGIGSAVSWVWNSVLQPIWEGIKVAFSIVVTYITVQVQAWVFVFQNVLAPVFTWLYDTVIQPVWNGIKTVIGGVVDWFTGTAWPFLQSVITAIGTAFGWMKDAIGAAWNWVRNNIVAPVIAWFQNTVQPIIQAVVNAIIGAWNNFRDGVAAAWNFVKNSIVQPVVDWFQNTIVSRFISIKDSVVGAFNAMRDGIGRAWNAIKDLAATPVRFVVNSVVAPLVETYNSVATKFGAAAAPVPHFAYAQGGIHRPAQIADRPILWAEAGPEAYIPLSASKRSRSLEIWAQTGQILGALPMADGGILGKAWQGAKNLGSKALDAATWILDVLKAPVEWFKNKVNGWLGGIGSSPFAQMVANIPRNLAESIGSWVKDKFSSIVNYTAGAGVKQWEPVAIQAMALAGLPPQYLPLLMHRMQVESGGNPNAINNWDINAKNGVPSQGLMQTIPPTFAAYAGPLAGRGITDPLANIYAAIKYTIARYGIGGIEAAWGGTSGYATGTPSAARGLAWVGERGPELINFGGGERVYNNQESTAMIYAQARRDLIDELKHMRLALVVGGKQMDAYVDERIGDVAYAAAGARW